MKKALVLLGATGSGKSTVGKMIAEQLGYHYVSTGDLARELIEKGGDDTWQAIGDFAPEAELRRAFLDDIAPHDRVVIDGMPRKMEQITFLEGHFDEIECVYLIVGMSKILERLADRDRVDDQERTIKLKLRKFNRVIANILESIHQLIKNGDSAYKAVTSIKVDKRTPEEVAEIILGRVE